MVSLLSLAVNESSCNFKKICSVFRAIFFLSICESTYMLEPFEIT